MNSTFGTLFRVSILGESHGPKVGALVEGCPPGIPIDPEMFRHDLARRQGGQPGTTPRREKDEPIFSSGVYNGFTTGTPILVEFSNEDTRSKDYQDTLTTPRPGHADLTGRVKANGFNDPRGGGHFSGRLTVGVVAAGVIAKAITGLVPRAEVYCGLGYALDLVEEARREGDSVGGVVQCVTEGVPVGLGEPFWDSAESLLAHAAFSIPGVRGVEFGDGFEVAGMTGSQHNDLILSPDGITTTNGSGGINGGITNGNPLIWRIAVKPTSSIRVPQHTTTFDGEPTVLKVKGRHDAAIVLRVPPIMEAMTSIVLADLMLQDCSRKVPHQ